MKRGLAGTVSSTAPSNDSVTKAEHRARVLKDTGRENEVLRQTYHSATFSTTNTTWTGCASKNVFNFSVFIASTVVLHLVVNRGSILGAVFSLMTSLTLCIAYCGVRPALNVKISRLALVPIFWDPWYRVCSKKKFFSGEINKFHEQ
jgi:hypothetical protein